MCPATDVLDLVTEMKTRGEPFALATVVRTVSVTAAKAGAKAVIRRDGSISGGWIGGGCARAAVLKAARESLVDGRSRLVSVQPGDLLDERGLQPGQTREGVVFARNFCPSQGTMDIFVEPMLPRPLLVVFGSSPVALALTRLAPELGFRVALRVRPGDAFPSLDDAAEGFALPPGAEGPRYLVVATQGSGDEAALRAALVVEAQHRAFVGSRRKIEALRAKLQAEGQPAEALEQVKAPAGLDLGGITPEEIALSILAEIVLIRRAGARETG